ncbi:MAG: AAA family ATPase, partial [Alphaproteobacteria bacterium]|nr:AAA family ATPase [Alphaproteobacteria bacterium]
MSEPVDIDDLPTFVAAGGQSIKERAQKFLDDEAARAEADKRREEQDRARAKELAARAVEPRPRGDFIVANFFRKRAVGLLVAAGSGGKTTFANHLCAHLAVGASVLGTVVTGAFKCFIAGLEEDQAQMDAFFSAAQHGVKAPDRKVVRPSRSGGGGAVIVHGREYWHGERVMFGLRHGKAPGPLTGWYLLRERALQAKAKMGRLDLLVIDSASLAFGGDVNDRGHVVAFLDLIAELADELDCAVLLLAHTNKSSRAGRDRPAPIGSTAWEDQVDFVLSMMPPPPVKKPGEIGAEPVLGEDADRIHLRVTKSNQGPIGIGVELTKVPFGSDAIRLEERQFPSAGELLVQAQKRAKADQLLVLR